MKVTTVADGKTMSRLILAGIAAGAIANLCQMPFFRGLPEPIPLSFFLSHLLAVWAVHVTVAISLGQRSTRGWAVAVFVVPVVLALWPTAERLGGIVGIAAVTVLAALFAPLLVRWTIPPGVPWFSGACGAFVGGVLLWFRVTHEAGILSAPLTAGSILLIGMAALGITLAAGRHAWLAATCIPSRKACVAVAACAVGLAMLAAPVWTGPFLERLHASGDTGRGEGHAPGPTSEGGVNAVPTTGRTTGPPVVLLVLDALRADHLRAYGYEQDTMPGLEEFMAERRATPFRAVSASSWSAPSHASMFTGLEPPEHGAHGPFLEDLSADAGTLPRGYPLRDDVPTLAGLLAERGYWTVGLSANYGPLAGYGLQRGFELFYAEPAPPARARRLTPWTFSTPEFTLLAAVDSLPPFSSTGFFAYGDSYALAEIVTDRTIEVVNHAGDRPFFMFVNYMDAHTPWHLRGEGVPGLLDPLSAPHGGITYMTGEATVGTARRSEFVAAYDAELRYLDRHLTRLLRFLEAHPRASEILVIVTSDHGEALGERGLFGHGGQLYGELVDIPFFVTRAAAPGRAAPAGARAEPSSAPDGSESGTLVGSADVFSTVLAHTGIEPPTDVDAFAWGRGRRLLRSWAYLHPMLVEAAPQRFARELQSVEVDGWKLIDSTPGDPELYDLAADPDERQSLAESYPDRLELMRGLLLPRETAVRPSGLPAREDRELLERLRALGYIR